MKKVKLISIHGEQEFTPGHAQNILQIAAYMNKICRGGPTWALPEDSPYEFINNGLIKRTNKGDSKKPAASKGDTKGSESPGEAKVS